MPSAVLDTPPAKESSVSSIWRGFIERTTPNCCIIDALVLLVLMVGGFIYHADAVFWSVGYMGVGSASQYGDAQFWWSGVQHLVQGIVADNPGRGFRPGYFVLSAFPVSLFDWSFFAFHKFFMVMFLASCSWLYLTMRPILGRFAAAFALALIVFNPFTAEWTSTSTTDSMGMALNIAALCLLITATRQNFSQLRLWLFGITFSIATLTRPLVTPFIAVPLLVVLAQRRTPIRRRIINAITLVAAFLLPTIAWLCIQKAAVGEMSISQNDASPIYAASDPKIQVWTAAMYTDVKKSAQAHLGKADVTLAEINEEFWRRTQLNYIKNLKYHFRRLFPHTWLVADFTSKMSNHPAFAFEFIGLNIFLGLSLLANLLSRNRRGVIVAIGLLALSLYSNNHPGALVLIATVMSVYWGLRKRDGLPMLFLATYWWIGVFALAFVGGTWGQYKHWDTYFINALGYRLGCQFFFVATLLQFYFLSRVMQPVSAGDVKNANGTYPLGPPAASWLPQLLKDNMPCHLVCWMFLACCLVTLLATEIGGAFVVGTRIYERSIAKEVLYPPVGQLKEVATRAHLTSLGSRVLESQTFHLSSEVPESRKLKKHSIDSSDVLVTGCGTDFNWNLQSQNRAQMMICLQKRIVPFDMHPGTIIVEVPTHVAPVDWKYKQGIFVLRRVADLPNENVVPYYRHVIAVRGFIPLSLDRSTYQLSDARWFQIQKYASQLMVTGELMCKGCTISWDASSGNHPYQRRFLLKPLPGSSEASLILSLANAVGDKSLKFAIEPVDALIANPVVPTIVTSTDDDEAKTVEISHELHSVKLQLPSDARQVRIAFKNLQPSGVYVYEMNLRADDFVYDESQAAVDP